MENVKDYPPYLDYPKQRKTITKADKIRAMTDEELSSFLCKVRNGDVPMWCDYRKCETRSSCGACRLNWLKREDE